MEPDFESTPEALVARVELRSITSSQVLARPSEWLELLRRYGNVPLFFLGSSKVLAKALWPSRPLGVCLRSYVLCGKALLTGADLRRCQRRWTLDVAHRLFKFLRHLIFFLYRLRSPACLVFSGELQKYRFFRR